MRGRVIFKAAAGGVGLEADLSEMTPLDLLVLASAMNTTAAGLIKDALRAMGKRVDAQEPNRIILPGANGQA